MYAKKIHKILVPYKVVLIIFNFPRILTSRSPEVPGGLTQQCTIYITLHILSLKLCSATIDLQKERNALVEDAIQWHSVRLHVPYANWFSTLRSCTL